MGTSSARHEPESLRAVAGRNRAARTALALGTLVTLSACGGDDTATPTTPPQEPSRPAQVAIEPDSFVVTAGETVRLKSVVEDQRGKLMFNVDLTWTSSVPGVATVDTAGIVTGIREGTATVTVTAGSVTASAPGRVHSEDRRTLMDIFYSAGGEGWTDGGNWGSTAPVGNWHGVEANAGGRVTALRLSDNGLSGTLPEDLGNLVFLTELDLDGNEDLSGPIPVSLSALGIERLQYGGTRLCTVRDEGFRTWLDAIPARDGDFIACNEERSDLMTLYDAMGGEDWAYSDNWGTNAGLASWYGITVDGETGRVTQINLNRNGLSGEVPPEIRYFPQLRVLRLDYNNLEGEVPPEIGELTELRRMDIDGNHFTGGIPPEIGNLEKLEELWMGGNRMSGPIPPELGNLSNLRYLYLYDAAFDGSIPAEFGALTELRQLEIRGTWIDGSLPPALGALNKLRTLDVNGNQLTGPLPAELGRLDSLRVLDATRNRLTGPLPPELGQLDSLDFLLLRDNMIDGPLPAELGQLTSLRWMSLAYNMLSGPLPPGWADMEELAWLHVEYNPDLSGPLPDELNSLMELRELIAHETGLCAPTGPEVRDWLNDVVTKWRVRSCGAQVFAEAHLIQSTQSSDYPVPLVAGRSALLRVFVTSDQETTESIPPVRARFFVDGTEVHVADIPAGSATIPTEVQVGVIELSANVEISGDVIQPGLEMVVEVDPDGTVSPALGVSRRIPAEGRAAVEVREVPPLILTLVPFISRADNNREAVSFVTNATVDHELFFETKTLLPVGTFELRKHSSVTVDSNNIFDMLSRLEQLRLAEQGTGHWMGLNAFPAGAGGVAYLGANSVRGRGKISISRLDVGTIAHELGHNLNLRHADCGGPANTDTTFPYQDARTGVWGYDPRGGGSLVPPNRADLMSYCNPVWVSDYYFTNAFRFRMADTTEIQTAPAQTLLVSGGASADGVPHLDPAFVIETSPVVPGFGGSYRLAGRRADGSELFAWSFDMQEVMDGDGRSGFAFALPVQDGWATELSSLVLTGPGGSVEMREGSEAPLAIMRDPRTGQVRAILRNLPADPTAPGALEALAPEPGLDIMVSGGLPGVAEWRR